MEKYIGELQNLFINISSKSTVMIRNEKGLAKAIMKGEYRIELFDDLV